jgi:integrase/recombinase XerD
MEAKTTKRQYNTVLSQAKKGVPGFALAYGKFIEKTTLAQSSKGLIVNYSRSLAYIALHFGRVPHQISVDEINAYLYSMMVHEKCSLTYFKHAVFALRYWFRLFDMEDKAIQMPPIKKEKKLPVVLSRQECKELFKAPVNLKHRFLLTFAYGGGLRMNELRLIKISDVDLHRRQVHIRHGKGLKQRLVTLSKLLSDKLPHYISAIKPTLYLFEGLTPGQPMGQRSIQYIISEALQKTSIQKQVSMHTLRHSFATHLLEDGVDIHTIQHLLGHADLIQTLVYLHVAQVKNKPAHSPLDTLYNIITPACPAGRL